MVGSFLNVLVWRLPNMLARNWRQQARDILELPGEALGPTYNLMLPHSHCPHCNHSLRAWENIPLLSYLMLRGRCTSCKTRSVPVTRWSNSVARCSRALSPGTWGFGWQAAGLLVLSWALLALCLIDADHQLLPDVLVMPLLWLG